MVVFGTIGSGKSSLVKCYLLRSGVFGVKARVLDPKAEYVRLPEAMPGAQIIRVGLDGTVRINPLDPAIRPAQQRAVVEALVEATAGARLGVVERAALAATLAHVRTTIEGATLADLRAALWSPPAEVVDRQGGNRDRVATAAAPSAAALDLVLDGELATLVGGRSTVPPDPACPLLVADVSEIVPLGGTEVAAAMAVVGTWLQTLLAARAGRQIIVLDECWRLLRDPSTARWLQSSAKLAREYQAQLVTIFHRLSDLSAVGDEGSEQVQIARGLISDAETRVIYRQSPGDAALLAEVLGLSGAERDLVPRLGRALGLWRIGARATVVRHLLSSWEAPLVETEAHRRADLPGRADGDGQDIHGDRPASELEADAVT